MSAPSPFYFDDVAIDGEHWSAPAELERATMVDFARRWDPLPIHLDDAAAQAGASPASRPGSYLLALKNRLLSAFGFEMQVIASFGFDGVRFHAPGLPGDTVRLKLH